MKYRIIKQQNGIYSVDLRGKFINAEKKLCKFGIRSDNQISLHTMYNNNSNMTETIICENCEFYTNKHILLPYNGDDSFAVENGIYLEIAPIGYSSSLLGKEKQCTSHISCNDNNTIRIYYEIKEDFFNKISERILLKSKIEFYLFFSLESQNIYDYEEGKSFIIFDKNSQKKLNTYDFSFSSIIKN